MELCWLFGSLFLFFSFFLFWRFIFLGSGVKIPFIHCPILLSNLGPRVKKKKNFLLISIHNQERKLSKLAKSSKEMYGDAAWWLLGLTDGRTCRMCECVCGCVCGGGGARGGGWGKLDFCKTLLLQEPLHYINRPFIPISLFFVLGLLWVVMVTRCVVRSNMQWGEAMK